MTLEQLVIFVAVAEREHLTRAAETLGLTPSAVSAAIRKLEENYGVDLFDRVGRGIALTQAGRMFLPEARATVARAQTAERVLGELGGLEKGALSIYASQTIASYLLPPILMRFHQDYPGIELSLTISNTAGVAKAVSEGLAEIGFIEGAHENDSLSKLHMADDALVVVVAPDHPFAALEPLMPDCLIDRTTWIMREKGSGTRSAFESSLTECGLDPISLKIVLDLPSNEAVLSAVRHGKAAAAISEAVAAPYLAQGLLVRANIDLPTRAFNVLTRKDRQLSKAASLLVDLSC
ncbi:MAG: LysR family transcriptional regulator [Rhodobacteraceae bacterium]|nr:LysR family transcriptional regulator [Paracoccaceae bacterium]